MTRRIAPKATREQIEQAIARGWSDDRMYEQLRVSYETVAAVRKSLDRLSGEADSSEERAAAMIRHPAGKKIGQR